MKSFFIPCYFFYYYWLLFLLDIEIDKIFLMYMTSTETFYCFRNFFHLDFSLICLNYKSYDIDNSLTPLVNLLFCIIFFFLVDDE